MIKLLTESLTKFNPLSQHHSFIRIKQTKAQRNNKFFKIYWKQLGAFWLFLAIITMFYKGISLNNIFLINILLLPIYISIYYLTIQWLNSIYSPIPKYRIKRLLTDATEELNLIQNHDDSINQTKWIKWEFWIKNNKIFINCYLGAFVTPNLESNLGHKLTNYFIKITGDIEKWNLIDSINDTEHGRINLIYGLPRKRRTINNISDLEHSKELLIQLDSELFITKKTPHTLVVGPTRSGKTTTLKTLLISAIALSPENSNKVFICDGKNSYLASVSKSIKNSRLATNSKELLTMLNELCNIMNERYKLFTNNPFDERDVTYCEIKNEGLIFFFFDEVLALYSEIEASDKLLKPTERILPQIQARVNNLLQKGAAANISVIMSLQQAPASTLSTAQRSAFGCRIACGRIDDIQSQEIFGLPCKKLPKSDTSDYSGVIWLDGQGWDNPKSFQLPYFNDNLLPFKATLRFLTESVSEAEKA